MRSRLGSGGSRSHIEVMALRVGAGLWLIGAGAVGLGCDNGAALEPGVQTVGGPAASSSTAGGAGPAGAAVQADAGAQLAAGGMAAATGFAGSPGVDLGGAGGASAEGGGANGGSANGGGANSGSAGMGGLVAIEGPHPIRALQIVTGTYHSCALLENHQVKCWGNNGYGQLGLGDTEERGLLPEQMGDALPFVDLGTGRSVKSISAGRYMTCAILDDDSVKCWGLTVLAPESADSWQLGDQPGEMGDTLAVVPMGDGHTAKAAAVGYGEACIVRDDDTLICGDTGAGHREIAPMQDNALLQVVGMNTVLTLRADGVVRSNFGDMLGTGVTAMVANDRAYCFKMQDSTISCSEGPMPGDLATRLGFASLALTEVGRATCGLDWVGQVWCWGSGSDRPWASPMNDGIYMITLGGPAVALSGGQYHFCARLEDGAVACWSLYNEPKAAVGRDETNAYEIQSVDLGTWGE